MVGLITRTQLKASLPRLVPTILDLYKKDEKEAFLATLSRHNPLTACLLSESGPPLLDFEDLILILCTVLPEASINNKDEHSDFSMGLKTYNEIQHCFLVIGSVYPDELYDFLLSKCQSKDEPAVVGALGVIKHLLSRLLETWHGKRTLLVDVVKLLLDERSWAVRKALAELLVLMASLCYLSGSTAELSIEYLARHCAITDEEVHEFNVSKDVRRKNGPFQSFQFKNSEVLILLVNPAELRDICEKGLLLLAITIPEMEYILWPFLLKLMIPREYTGAIATVLCYLGPLFPKNLSLFWQDEVFHLSDLELMQDSTKERTAAVESSSPRNVSRRGCNMSTRRSLVRISLTQAFLTEERYCTFGFISIKWTFLLIKTCRSDNGTHAILLKCYGLISHIVFWEILGIRFKY